MTEGKNTSALKDSELDGVSGGVMSPGAAMICMVNAPLYKANPAGNHFRSASEALEHVAGGTPVKIYEYGAKYCKVVCGGKIGWIETDLLANM
jgi:hypothetical protein